MARTPMYKVKLLVPRYEASSFLEKLQEMGIMHISSKNEIFSDVHELAETVDKLARVKKLVDFVLPYRKFKKEPIETIAEIKHPFVFETKSDFENSANVVINNLENIENELKVIKDKEVRFRDESRKIKELINKLKPFVGLNVKLNELGVGKKVSAFLTLIKKPYKIKKGVHLQVVKEVPEEVYALLVKKNDINFDHNPVDVPDVNLTPAEYIKLLSDSLPNLEKVEVEKQKFAEKWMEYLTAAYDYLDGKKMRLEAYHASHGTKKTILIEGWIARKHKSILQKLLNEEFKNAYYLSLEIPKKGENVPVVLKNSWAKPFEVVTRSFGLPNYFESDPTPFLAPFFLLFTGLCLTDAGYGIALAIVGYLLSKRYPTFKNFFTLIMYIGISTTVMGALFGGWLTGLIPIKPLIFDAVSSPVTFLVLSLLLGFIHLTVGLFVEAYDRWREGDLYAAFVDNISWVILTWGILFYGLAANGILDNGLAPVFSLIAISGALILIWTQGRTEKNIFKRIGIGLISLYGLIGFLSDVLSYSRVLALGLATGVVGMVVNQLATMLIGIPYVGVVLMIPVLIIGHIFNLVLSALGSYIHSSRLQYVEFFSKFLEGGGMAFRPLRRGDKFTEYKV